MYKEDLALNNLQSLICHKTKQNKVVKKTPFDYSTIDHFLLQLFLRKLSPRVKIQKWNFKVANLVEVKGEVRVNQNLTVVDFFFFFFFFFFDSCIIWKWEHFK